MIDMMFVQCKNEGENNDNIFNLHYTQGVNMLASDLHPVASSLFSSLRVRCMKNSFSLHFRASAIWMILWFIFLSLWSSSVGKKVN